MRLTSRSMLALTMLLAVGGALPILAQQRPQVDRQQAERPRAAPVIPATPRTGKERMGGKWMDEQRLDNCKVPPDKRGATPRPDACPNDPAW